MPKMLHKFASPPLMALLCLSMLVGLTPRYAAAAAGAVIEHQALDYAVTGRRIKVEAKVSDPQGVKLVRCYFRAANSPADFAYVDMAKAGEDAFAAELPALAQSSTGIEYALVVVGGQNAVYKSNNMLVPVKNDQAVPAWQSGTSQRQLVVSLEGASAPQRLAGFDDNYSLTPGDPTQNYGALAGLTGASSSGTTGTFAGTAATSSGGISTRTALLIAGGAVLVGGGIAIAAANSGGGGGGGGGGSSAPAGCACSGDTTVTQTNITITGIQDDPSIPDEDMVVHIKLNGDIVLPEIRLNHEGISTAITLNKCPATNTITVVAINQSDNPPNRGAFQLTNVVSGKPSTFHWSLMAGDEQNWTICTQ